MKVLRRLVVVVLAIALSIMASVALADMPKDNVISKAKKALEDKGVIVVDCNIMYDEGNDAWEEWGILVANTPDDKNYGNLPKGALENKKYQAVYFDFYDDAKKDIWVFVDPVTGNVLEIYEKK